MASYLKLEDRPYGDNATRREHLESFRRQGIEIPGLEGKPVPEGAEHLFMWALRLSRRRSYLMDGTPTPVSFTDTKDFAALLGVRLEWWEVEGLEAAEEAILAHTRSRGEHGRRDGHS